MTKSRALFLDHVNLNVETWSPEVERFWFGALGFVPDPRAKRIHQMIKDSGGTANGLVWANIGMQQIHMPLGEPEDGSQSMPNGILGLTYPDLTAMRRRLQQHGIRFEEEPGDSMESATSGHRWFGPALKIESPTGVQIRLHQGNKRFAPDGADEAGCKQPGGTSLGLGMPYVEFVCNPGASAGIGRYYKEVLGIDTDDVGGACRVLTQTGQFLLFRETHSEVPAYDNHHVAIYMGDPATGDVDSTFVSMYHRCKQAGFVWNNPRFPHLTYDTLADALRNSEFRIVDLQDPKTGKTVYQLEHEIRSLKHGGFSCKELLPMPGIRGAARKFIHHVRRFLHCC